MLCKKPFNAGTVPFGCGQCLHCRINKSRQWMWRQVLESFSHEANSFVTLTYDDTHLPPGGNLVPRDLSLWLKRLRKAVHPRTFRVFAVGEYGEEGDREYNPHYHISVFGLSGDTHEHGRGNRRIHTHFGDAQIIHDTWKKGITWTKEFNAATALYVSGYTIKKMTDPKDPRLNGRHPEFSRPSRRPGIGATTVPLIAALLGSSSVYQLSENADVPSHLVMGGKKIPLGRFMLEKLRKGVGYTPEYIATLKAGTAAEAQIELLALLDDALTASEGFTSSTEVYQKEVRQRLLNAESQWKIKHKRRGSL